MPVLDIATPQSSFRNNHLYSIGFQTIHHVSFISGSGTARLRRYFHKPVSLEMCRGRLMIKAVATLEPRCSDNAQQLPIHSTTNLSDQPPVQDDKELLRRNRISKANKGREAWNKGVKHSAETRQKIRERTKLAMRNPEVKMKLLKGIHNQSHETKLKIAAAVRLTWDKRRYNRKMMLRCHGDWLNIIAEASRKGFCGEEELQWDSYEILSQQLDKEFLDGIESRKRNRGSAPGIRAPKTLEQRKKISEAIAAKWADPAYRDRVYCGIAKRRGVGPETRDPEWGTKKTGAKKTIKPLKKRENLMTTGQPKLKTSNSISSTPKHKEPQVARYKDPQARYKLEMIKSIRAQRAASDPKISEAILRANVLIAEAQRAAEALEEAAAKNPMAKASLAETRKLIAEAISYLNSIHSAAAAAAAADSDSDKEEVVVVKGVGQTEPKGVNGVALNTKFGDAGLKANGMEHVDLSSPPPPPSSSWSASDLRVQMKKEMEEAEKQETGGKNRRWVCGRLVEDENENENEDH